MQNILIKYFTLLPYISFLMSFILIFSLVTFYLDNFKFSVNYGFKILQIISLLIVFVIIVGVIIINLQYGDYIQSVKENELSLHGHVSR